MWLYILQFLLVSKSLAETDRWYCPYILETSKRATTCPTKEDDIKAAAARLNCKEHSLVQNCTDPKNFKYHCVIDAEGIHLYEVCAEDRFILGYCTELNIAGARIQGHYSKKCTVMDPPCPVRYRSSEAFKYPVCYNLEKSRPSTRKYENEGAHGITANLTTEIPNDNSISEQVDALDSHMIYITIGVLTFLVGAAVMALYYGRKKCGQHRRKGSQRYCPHCSRRSSESSQGMFGNQDATALIHVVPKIENNQPEDIETCIYMRRDQCDENNIDNYFLSRESNTYEKAVERFKEARSLFEDKWLSGRNCLISHLKVISNGIQTVFDEETNREHSEVSNSFPIAAAMVASYRIISSFGRRESDLKLIKVKDCRNNLTDIRHQCAKALRGMNIHVTDTQKLNRLLGDFGDLATEMPEGQISNLGNEVHDNLSNKLRGLQYNVGHTGRSTQDINMYLREILGKDTFIGEELNKHLIQFRKVIESLEVEASECSIIFNHDFE